MPRRMPDRRSLLKLGLCWLVLAGALLAWAQLAWAEVPTPLRLAVMDAKPGTTLGQVLSGRAGGFTPVLAPGVSLAGSEHPYWVRVQAVLPDLSENEHYWVLWLDRVDLERVVLHLPGQLATPAQYFFAPRTEDGALFGGFVFRLPTELSGPVTLYLEVDTRVAVSLHPRLMTDLAFQGEDRSIAVLLAGIYVVLVVLALTGVTMFLALRDATYLVFVAFVLGLLGLLLAINGHLYALPALGVLAPWQSAGIFFLAHLAGAFALLLARHFAELGRVAPGFHRAMLYAAQLLFVAALASLVAPPDTVALQQVVSISMWIGAGLLCVWSSLLSWQRGRPLGRALTLIWLALLASVVLRSLVPFGIAPQNVWTVYGFQVMLAASAFLFSIALADRIMEFRKQRDRARLAKEQTDASLQVEQGRRLYVEGLHTGLRSAVSGDLEWLALRRLLEGLRPLIPQRDSAVIAFGYHGLDLLIAEPLDAKDRYSRLLSVRGGTLKGICRSRTAVQVKLEQEPGDEDRANGGLFAVVPLPIEKPGWGGVLVERAPWEGFDPTELHLIAEFASMAISAADEAAAALELKRKAELDPLTGAYNLRAIDTQLANAFAHAYEQHQPLSVLFVDLDLFKQVNDRHGHAAGDHCLRLIADAIRHELGAGDVFGRYGGEEFILVLPGRGSDQARLLGERLRVAVSELRIENSGSLIRLTVSIGVAARQPHERQPQPVVDRADKALYAAKRGGRNQVQVAPIYGDGPEPIDAPIL